MDCQAPEAEFIDEYVCEELSKEEMQKVENHILNCEECFEDYEFTLSLYEHAEEIFDERE